MENKASTYLRILTALSVGFSATACQPKQNIVYRAIRDTACRQCAGDENADNGVLNQGLTCARQKTIVKVPEDSAVFAEKGDTYYTRSGSFIRVRTSVKLDGDKTPEQHTCWVALDDLSQLNQEPINLRPESK